MRRQLLVAVLSVSAAVFVASAGALAQGPRPQAPSTSLDSKFTYQGQLKRNNASYSGTCNMQFGLFDAPSGGTPVGIAQTLPSVNVSNGLFTVVLNDAGQFSGSAFSGAARWLEAAVQCSGDGGYTTLTRQQLTAVPYALYATGNWALSGNGGTNPNTNYLGTSDNAALTIGVSGTAALRMVPSADGTILIGGYNGNTATGIADGATIGGGGSPVYGANVISGTNVAWSTIGGGVNNRISDNAPQATIGGGYDNAANNGYTTVSGGYANTAGGWDSTVSGGQGNVSNGDRSTVGGGQGNTASGDYSTVSGGYGNTIAGTAHGATIAGGGSDIFGGNVVSGTNVTWSTIGGGVTNRISGNAYNATIGGGYANAISGTTDAGRSVIAGGWSNAASGFVSTVGGGQGNTAGANYSMVGGGIYNTAKGYTSTVSGGQGNTASGDGSFVGGGAGNTAGGAYSTVSGGNGNTVAGYATGATIGGGGSPLYGVNVISGTNVVWSTIAGGVNNRISGNAYNATIGGGSSNAISGTVDADRAVIAGGWLNAASGPYSTVGGGWSNTASGLASTVSGGQDNTASGLSSSVGGGHGNTASGWASFAAGKYARAVHDGAFVWADNQSWPISSTAANQFIVRASGGITLFSNSVASIGAALPPGSSAWSTVSDRSAKMNFASVDGRQVLAQLAGIPVETWSYKTQDASIRHIGPMAQDFRRAFGVGENDTTISTVDEGGVALAAIQGLNQLVQEQQAEIGTLQTQIAQLQTQVSAQSQGTHTSGTATSSDSLLPMLVGLSLLMNGVLGVVVVIHVRK